MRKNTKERLWGFLLFLDDQRFQAVQAFEEVVLAGVGSLHCTGSRFTSFNPAKLMAVVQLREVTL